MYLKINFKQKSIVNTRRISTILKINRSFKQEIFLTNEFLRFWMDKKLLIELERMKFFENILEENHDGLKTDNIF